MNRTLRTALLATAIAWPITHASAQEVAASAEGTNEVTPSADEIVVTGTRIARPELDFANPVVVFSADAIAKSGRTNIAQFLQRSPALVGSITGARTGGSNPNLGEAGLNLLDLRNLGVDRTLVLVDGRRHVAGSDGSAAVDINTIPQDLIEATDVLTGGVSAIYGADGVSGVVNFRLKKDFEGIAASGQVGISEEGDGLNRYGAITIGHNFAEGRGNVAIAYEYNSEGRVNDQARGWLRRPRAAGLYINQNDLDDDPGIPDYIPYRDVRYADSSRMGAVDVDFDYAADYEGNGRFYDRGTILENSGGYTVGGSSTPVDGYQGDLFPGSKRHIVNAIAHYDFSDAFKLFVEGKYARNRVINYAQPMYDFYLFATPDNPFMPQSIRDAILPGGAADYWFGDPEAPDGVLVTRDHFDLGIGVEDARRETLRGVIGANGELNDHLRYEVSYVYGETKTRIQSLNNRRTDRFMAAIDVVTDPVTGQAVCRSSLDPEALNFWNTGYEPVSFTPGAGSGCVPYNIFGDGQNGAAAAQWINASSLSRAKLTQQVVSGSLSGDFGALFELPGGPIGFALGGEWRRETSSFNPDDEIEAGWTWFGAVQPVEGRFSVKEGFAELNAPLLKDVPGAHILSFGAAIRYSDYSYPTLGTSKTSTSWKVDGTYAPISDITFRASYSQAVRAPNIGELFQPNSANYNFITDPCDITEQNNGTSTREANCATLLTGLNIDPTTFSPLSDPSSSLFTLGQTGGNPNLREETAKTWTAGLVLRPSFLPNFTATFDWYDIRISDAINTPEAVELAELCVDQPTLENVYCGLIDRDSETGFINGFRSRPDNVAQFRTAGLDVALNYQLNTANLGVFAFNLVGNYLDRLTFVATPGAEVNSDRGEIYAPRYQATFNLGWTKGPFNMTYGLLWHSKTNRATAEDLAGDPDYYESRYMKYKAKWEHEVQLGYDVDERFNVYFGVNNLFNQKPDQFSRSYPVSAMGRYFYAGAKLRLADIF